MLRGSVWGSDSFAYWAYSCFGNVVLNDSNSFLFFVKNIVNCNLFNLAVIISFLYFLVLLSIYFFGKKWFKDKAYLLPIYFACLTPLIFIEVLRFENDFFGWSLAFIALGCFSLSNKKIGLIIGSLLAVLSLLLWVPSIFILLLAVFLMDLPLVWYYLFLGIGLVIGLSQYVGYALGSFTNGIGLNAVSEEIPLVGLVFILHVLHFYKKIPLPVKYYGIFLLLLGALKSKYMFLAVLPLIMGLLAKELDKGLSIPKLGIEKIPVLAFCVLFCIGWFVMGFSMYPTQTDLTEMKEVVNYVKDTNQLLFNDWGDGWMLISLGYDTNFKSSFPNPDWNKLERPFVAWSKEKIVGCVLKGKRTQYC